jgi:hypothetical protein
VWAPDGRALDWSGFRVGRASVLVFLRASLRRRCWRFTSHPSRRSREGWAPGFFWWLRVGRRDLTVLAVYIPPFAEARRMGHPIVFGWLRVGRRDLAVLVVYIPPFAKCAKDGAPDRFWSGDGGKAGLGGAGGLHPTLREGAAKDGAP